jgi:threonine synthase
VETADFLDEYRGRASGDGIFMEASSAVAVAAARQLSAAPADGIVVALGTSSGLKDVDLILQDAPALPVLRGGLDELTEFVEKASG